MGGGDIDGPNDSVMDSAEDVTAGMQPAEKERIEQVHFDGCKRCVTARNCTCLHRTAGRTLGTAMDG